ncbi:MAG TPA: hypothetical protein DEQ87_00020 [Algoriphagus sp.]|jgi:hypothetical protein|uniref:hypothetical protein n=1 Tax=unclassified Algoriphagus TaxID=2641541 RepID=UPI000C39E472|nr:MULTISPECIES: hypothetical protein [unclassified Algoriphagus]MAL14843.1 hypothetical protein [Algoriphagus sp.]MAN88480.1 hypothetical protein [Algoriphagus sp.]HAS58235.1 hypothetical protein [Algoriphagus sp.]HCD86020.1 hypothetical protein [Algoriphagus sp.]HCH45818.1 hypothetical protein [Algoriphagus sp.]|tara:strand:- start:401 stop:1006 length:606 start_codon:yes stop_codon:yes gene_type:complete
MEQFNHLIKSITDKGLKPNINLDRPTYIQPEDRIQFRSTRILIILGMLNNKFGLSKNVIACIDFLLRNEAFQAKFIVEYFNGQKNVLTKLSQFKTKSQVEIDFNIVQYKSVPWDIRFNDMFLYLYVRDLITYKADENDKNIRIQLTETGKGFYEKIKDVFPAEINFLELFGSRLVEDRAINIITEVIPNSYWKQNVETDNK